MSLGNILIGGGRGFIGQYLQTSFQNCGSKVTIVSRMPGLHHTDWNTIRHGLPKDTRVVINLSGQNVLDPRRGWSEGFKQNVFSSRINTTKSLVTAVKNCPTVRVFINISGVSIYPPSDTTIYTEESTDLKPVDFPSQLCHEWESALMDQELPPSVRKVIIRSGVVLGESGGIVRNMFFPFYFGVGGRLGSGKQPFPWIHINDLVRMFLFAAEEEKVTGILNGVAPQIITNGEFTKAFGKAMWRPSLFPVPEAIVNLIFSKERAVMVLKGAKVLPQRAMDLGFTYQFNDVGEALRDIL